MVGRQAWQTLSKMIPGTLGGQARSATPVAEHRRVTQPRRRGPLAWTAKHGTNFGLSGDSMTVPLPPNSTRDVVFVAAMANGGEAPANMAADVDGNPLTRIVTDAAGPIDFYRYIDVAFGAFPGGKTALHISRTFTGGGLLGPTAWMTTVIHDRNLLSTGSHRESAVPVWPALSFDSVFSWTFTDAVALAYISGTVTGGPGTAVELDYYDIGQIVSAVGQVEFTALGIAWAELGWHP